jgi:hypothetical protein
VLVIGEGEADRRFLEHLIRRRGIKDVEIVKPAGGRPGFQQRLQAIKASPSVESIRLVVLVTDCDDDGNEAFRDLAAQVGRAGGYSVPQKSLQFSKQGEFPAVAVVLLPKDCGTGSLETLILEAMRDYHPMETERAEKFISDSPTTSVAASKRSKAVLAAAIAASCKDDPSCSASFMWKEERGYQDLLDHVCFNPLCEFLLQCSMFPSSSD